MGCAAARRSAEDRRKALRVCRSESSHLTLPDAAVMVASSHFTCLEREGRLAGGLSEETVLGRRVSLLVTARKNNRVAPGSAVVPTSLRRSADGVGGRLAFTREQ